MSVNGGGVVTKEIFDHPREYICNVRKLDVVLPHKGMLEWTTSAEAEYKPRRIRDCLYIFHQQICENAGLTLYCSTFDDTVGIDVMAVRHTALLRRVLRGPTLRVPVQNSFPPRQSRLVEE